LEDFSCFGVPDPLPALSGVKLKTLLNGALLGVPFPSVEVFLLVDLGVDFSSGLAELGLLAGFAFCSIWTYGC